MCVRVIMSWKKQ